MTNQPHPEPENEPQEEEEEEEKPQDSTDSHSTSGSRAVSSISQRTIVLRNEAKSFALATVPKEDLGPGISELQGTSLLIRLASDLYGVPRSSIITSQVYERALGVIEGRDIWYAFRNDYVRLLGRNVYDPIDPGFDQRVNAFRRALEAFLEPWDETRLGWNRRALLARHGFLCQLGQRPNITLAQAMIFPDLPPFSFVLENISNSDALGHLSKEEIAPEAFLLALEVHDSALRPSHAVRDVVPQLYDYQVPFGSSPEISLKSIKHILQSAKQAVVVSHGEKMTREPPISVLVGLRDVSAEDNVVGVGSLDLPDGLEATIARGRGV